MRAWMLVPVVAAVVAAGPALGQSSPKTDDRPLTDQMFVDLAAASGTAEVMMGKLGRENAQDAAVKRFAARMVEDHTMSNKQLLGVVSELKLTAPPAAAPADHEKAMKNLSASKGADFDKAFMAQMVTDHEKAVALFERASKEVKAEQLRTFAANTLPTLREHLKMAQEINAKVGK
jgi:putative membrane protein